MNINTCLKQYSEFLRLIRYWDWYYKVESVAIVTLLLLLFTQSFKEQITNAIILILYLYIAYTYGYLLNSYTDREKDSQVGKDILGNYSLRFIKGLILLIGALTFSIPFLFKNFYVILVMLVGLFLASFYSLESIRLKERGLVGILVATIIHYLPFLLFLFLMPEHYKLVLYLFGWLLIAGSLIEVSHQIVDYKNDKKTNVKTLVTDLGIQKATNIIYSITLILIFYLFLPALFKINDIFLLVLILFVFSQNSLYKTYGCVKFRGFADFLDIRNYFSYGVRKIDNSIGRIGIFLRKHLPNLHFFLKKNKHYIFFFIFLLTLLVIIFFGDRIKSTNNFIDVAREAGVDKPLKSISFQEFTIMGKKARALIHMGAAWGDYNNDGCVDLYVANPAGANRLYQNNCHGGFQEVAEDAGVAYGGKSRGVSFGDIENDGCLDLFIANQGETNILYHNNCDGTFTNITKQAGVGGDTSISTSVAWADYDNDGFLDIFVANYSFATGTYTVLLDGNDLGYQVNTKRNFLYKNNKDTTFTEVAESAGIAGAQYNVNLQNQPQDAVVDSGMYYSSAWFDYDLDGCIDVLGVSNAGYSPLFRNNCDGTFRDVSEEVEIKKYYFGSGIAVADIDNNRYLDVYISDGANDSLFLNDGSKFTDVRVSLGLYNEQDMDKPENHLWNYLTKYDIGWGSIFFDYDNDGDKDLFVANGSYFFNDGSGSYNRFYEYQRGRFIERTKDVKLENELRSVGVAAADYDNDGDIDFYVTNTNGPNNLYENITKNRNHWITIRLKGTKSNILGIGAEVEVAAGDLTLYDQMKGGMSYLSQSEYMLHFGLGDKEKVDFIKIRWPAGTVQVIENIEVDRELLIIEE